ncbi:hypothetical protein MLD38_003770 [Melastoma candidum]|uniref:Uncharacterized protein n=1 Tax=Melastoma candidum TaxID=119954 RepID=A0ACB9S6T3_9MYRT|nr:hypothetical protein MLD38_003770 [Melastoma candidum]
MSQKGLIYSFVAKGTVVLAEHTSYLGNFSTIIVQCLHKLPSSAQQVHIFLDGHTFNFLVGLIALTCDAGNCYGASTGDKDPHPLDDEDGDLFEDGFSIAYNLDREFGPRLKEHMQYCITEITEVLDHGESIELLVSKTHNLQFQAGIFQRQRKQLRRKTWLQNIQVKLATGGAVALIILLFWLIAKVGGK